MLKFTELGLRRGSRLLFDQVTLTIFDGQKAGLVGANGAGKSSLFDLILNRINPDSGDVYVPSSWRIAHMAQEVATTDRTAIDYVLDGDTALRSIQQAIAATEAAEDYIHLGQLHEDLDSIDGYTAVSRAERLLVGLGFKETEFRNSLDRFSGGWRIRLNLAQTLMCPSDLLLLDEPTNHLDLDAIVWLGEWLKNYSGTLLMVSHDREFLDDVVSQIAYLHRETIDLYPGNYSRFEQLRAARLAEQQANFEKQQRQIAHMHSFVERFRAKATKAKQAQSRIKALQRMELIAPAHIDSPFQFRIPEPENTSNPLLSLFKCQLGYEDTCVINELTLSIHPGDRIGLLGPNGAGKSTLIKSLANELDLQTGERTEGLHLRVGYFSQHQMDDLDLHASPLLHLQRITPAAADQKIRSFLGGFGFAGDKSLEAVASFSGGEKARLALAIVAWRKPNLLLLDEPTNHLDIEMRHTLTVALQSFSGAMLIVSHDRHLLRNTVDRFLMVEKGFVTEFEGDLEDYQKNLSLPAPQSQSAAKAVEKPVNRFKHTRALRSTLGSTEKRLERLQRKLMETEIKLADNSLYLDNPAPDLQSLLRDQIVLREQIAELEESWLATSEELEKYQMDSN
jgi:ATP-binding cassette subfamily F protein 3